MNTIVSEGESLAAGSDPPPSQIGNHGASTVPLDALEDLSRKRKRAHSSRLDELDQLSETIQKEESLSMEEKQRRMGIIYSRRKRVRQNLRLDTLTETCESYRNDNKRLRDENQLLESLLHQAQDIVTKDETARQWNNASLTSNYGSSSFVSREQLSFSKPSIVSLPNGLFDPRLPSFGVPMQTFTVGRQPSPLEFNWLNQHVNELRYPRVLQSNERASSVHPLNSLGFDQEVLASRLISTYRPGHDCLSVGPSGLGMTQNHSIQTCQVD